MSISLNNISIGYGERVLLKGVSIEISGGQLVALLGRNGTGKSTLLRAIIGLEDVLEGDIKLCGRDIKTISVENRAKLISFVTTEKMRIANLTCEEIVSFGRTPYTNWKGDIRAEDRAVIARSIALVKMSDFAHKSIDTLSDGECQRVMIARALAQDTPIILLDEPTAFLDMPNRYELCLLLQRLARNENKTIIFSTHDLDIALSLCDTIALIDTPHLYHKPTSEMINSGHIERLFSSSEVIFDPTSQNVKLKVGFKSRG